MNPSHLSGLNSPFDRYPFGAHGVLIAVPLSLTLWAMIAAIVIFL